MAVTQDYQIDFNGLTVGDGTDYEIVAISGLADAPPVRAQSVALVQRHGQLVLPEYYEARSFTIDLEVVATSTSTMNTRMEELREAFCAEAGELTFTYRMPGLPGVNGNSHQLAARVRGFRSATNIQFVRGLAAVQVEFVAADPFIYSTSSTTTRADVSENAASGGTRTSNGDTFNQDGNAKLRPIVQFTGSLNSPELLVNNVSVFQLNYTISSSQTIEVDMFLRTITQTAGSAVSDVTYFSGEWLELSAGDVLKLRGNGSSNGGFIDTVWFDTWI